MLDLLSGDLELDPEFDSLLDELVGEAAAEDGPLSSSRQPPPAAATTAAAAGGGGCVPAAACKLQVQPSGPQHGWLHSLMPNDDDEPSPGSAAAAAAAFAAAFGGSTATPATDSPNGGGSSSSSMANLATAGAGAGGFDCTGMATNSSSPASGGTQLPLLLPSAHHHYQQQQQGLLMHDSPFSAHSAGSALLLGSAGFHNSSLPELQGFSTELRAQSLPAGAWGLPGGSTASPAGAAGAMMVPPPAAARSASAGAAAGNPSVGSFRFTDLLQHDNEPLLPPGPSAAAAGPAGGGVTGYNAMRAPHYADVSRRSSSMTSSAAAFSPAPQGFTFNPQGLAAAAAAAATEGLQGSAAATLSPYTLVSPGGCSAPAPAADLFAPYFQPQLQAHPAAGLPSISEAFAGCGSATAAYADAAGFCHAASNSLLQLAPSLQAGLYTHTACTPSVHVAADISQHGTAQLFGGCAAEHTAPQQQQQQGYGQPQFQQQQLFEPAFGQQHPGGGSTSSSHQAPLWDFNAEEEAAALMHPASAAAGTSSLMTAAKPLAAYAKSALAPADFSSTAAAADRGGSITSSSTAKLAPVLPCSRQEIHPQALYVHPRLAPFFEGLDLVQAMVPKTVKRSVGRPSRADRLLNYEGKEFVAELRTSKAQQQEQEQEQQSDKGQGRRCGCGRLLRHDPARGGRHSHGQQRGGDRKRAAGASRAERAAKRNRFTDGGAPPPGVALNTDAGYLPSGSEFAASAAAAGANHCHSSMIQDCFPPPQLPAISGGLLNSSGYDLGLWAAAATPGVAANTLPASADPALQAADMAAAGAAIAAPDAAGGQFRDDKTFQALVTTGFFPTGSYLFRVGTFDNIAATVLPTGFIACGITGQQFPSPSRLSLAVLQQHNAGRKSSNGWLDIKLGGMELGRWRDAFIAKRPCPLIPADCILQQP